MGWASERGQEEEVRGHTPYSWLHFCFLPGMSCPKEKKTRKKRNVNFQKAIHEKRELWVPM